MQRDRILTRWLTRKPVGVSILVGAALIGVGMFLPWQRTVEHGGQTSTQSGIHLAGITLLIIAASMAVFAAAFLTGRGGVGLKLTMLFLAVVCLLSVLLAVNAIGLPETTDLISFSFDIGFYMIALGTVVLLASTALAFKDRGPKTSVATRLAGAWRAEIAAVGGAILLVLGVVFFRGPAEVFNASVNSFVWNCDSCEHVLSVSRSRNYTMSWSFTGAMKPNVPPLAPGDQVEIESTAHWLVAVTARDAGIRYSTDQEFPPPFGPVTGLVGWIGIILGVLLLGIAAWSFVGRQARLERRLSAQSLVGGLICLLPGLYFFALFSGRLDAVDFLGLTWLVWLVAAGAAIVLGIMARRRERDRLALRMSAGGLGLAIVLTVGWPVAFLAVLSAAFSAGGG